MNTFQLHNVDQIWLATQQIASEVGLKRTEKKLYTRILMICWYIDDIFIIWQDGNSQTTKLLKRMLVMSPKGYILQQQNPFKIE
jgi:hypothetical protein